MYEKNNNSVVNPDVREADSEENNEFGNAPMPGSRKMSNRTRAVRYGIAAAVFIALAIPMVAIFLNKQHIMDDDVGAVLRVVEAIVGFAALVVAWVVIRFVWDLLFAAIYRIAKAFYGTSFGFGFVDALTYERNQMHDRRVRIRMAGVAAWLTVNLVMLAEILSELFSR